MNKLATVLFFILSLPVFSQTPSGVDFLKVQAQLFPRGDVRQIKGEIWYTFEIKSIVDSVFLDAKEMRIHKITVNNNPVPYYYDQKKIGFAPPQKLGTYSLHIQYSAVPSQTLYFIGWEDNVVGNEQIWTQGQGKYTSYWMPSFDDMTEKIEVDLAITFNKSFDVIANGKLVDVTEKNGLRTWHYNMNRPMSSYLVAFSIGHYQHKKLRSQSGIPLWHYYYPQDSNRVEPTYRYTEQIFNFLEKEIGVPYPWQNYKQIPVHDFLYAGMENTGSTIFSDAYVIDTVAFIDRNYVNINAHEMAHQWFGNLVTEKSGEHHWLQEGFATYYAYLAEKDIFGDDFFYWKLQHTAQQLKNLDGAGNGQSLLDPKASSLIFYEKGAWALAILRQKVGDNAFHSGVRNYLKKYQFKNATVNNFLDEIKNTSTMSLHDFRDQWLESKEFPWEEAKKYLIAKSESLAKFYDNGKKPVDVSNLVKGNEAIAYKLAILDSLQPNLTVQDYKTLLTSDELKIRQRAVEYVTEIPEVLQSYVEQTLGDSSYVTQETALYKLWHSFPERRMYYLDSLKGVIGLPNKNVRLLWLTLALVTEAYRPEQKTAYFEELTTYTTPIYNPEVRQLAFEYLSKIGGMVPIVLKELISATNHHSWQFRSFARRMLDDQLEISEQKEEILGLAQKLNDNDLRYLKTKVKLP